MRKFKVAQEMSDLVVYCVPRPKKINSQTMENLKITGYFPEPCHLMSSFNEDTATDLMIKKFPKEFQIFHRTNLSRIYPRV